MNKVKINVIINVDCIEVLKKFFDNSIDLIFVDLLYWMRISKILFRVEGIKFNGVEDEWDKFDFNDDYV